MSSSKELTRAGAGALVPLTNVSAFSFTAESGWDIGPHVHEDFHELVLVGVGAVRTIVGDVVLRGGSGEVLFYPQGRVHNSRAVAEGPTEMTFLRWAGGDGLADLKEPASGLDQSGRLQRVMSWLAELHLDRPGAEQTAGHALATAAVYEFGRMMANERPSLADMVRRQVWARPRNPPSLDEMAAAAHMSKFHFARRFQAEHGVSPMRYATQVRVNLAKDFLVLTNLTLDALAAETGFADAAHFSHVFRRVVGKSPGEFRVERRAG